MPIEEALDQIFQRTGGQKLLDDGKYVRLPGVSEPPSKMDPLLLAPGPASTSSPRRPSCIRVFSHRSQPARRALLGPAPAAADVSSRASAGWHVPPLGLTEQATTLLSSRNVCARNGRSLNCRGYESEGRAALFGAWSFKGYPCGLSTRVSPTRDRGGTACPREPRAGRVRTNDHAASHRARPRRRASHHHRQHGT